IHAMYDFWTPSRHYQAFHGGMRILTESASAKLASPITVEPGRLERDALGYKAREWSLNFLEAWAGGMLRLGDIVAEQHDPAATRKLLETLAFGQVEIEHNDAGDHVIRMAQPYSGWAKALLE